MKNDETSGRRSEPYKPRNIRRRRIKSFLHSKLSRYPAMAAWVIRLWKAARFSFLKGKWKLEALAGSRRGTRLRDIDMDKTYWIDPQKIVFSSLQEFDLHDFKGQILGGDWDLLEKRFDTLDLYIAIRQVCQEGKRWAETAFYQRVLDDLKSGRPLWSYRNEKDLVKKCHKIEALYDSIRRDGYKSQRELFQEGKVRDRVLAEEEVTVSIGRFGDLLFSDGAHRLAIAKLLGVPAIPVKITVRHADWVKFRDELSFYMRDNIIAKDGRLYQPVTHPDLSDLPASHESERRFRLIKDNLSAGQGRLLDIGANLGYFCHRFEELGFDCYAAENHAPTVYFLEGLARAENRRFKIITMSVLDSQVIRKTRFDVVLALNIFHHFLKTQLQHGKLVGLLENLQTDELYFEPHLPDELQMQDAYQNFTPEEFVAFISRNSRLKKARLLGVMADQRPVYKLTPD